MNDNRIGDKASRLIKIRDYLFELSPHGISSAELGRIFGISRSAALKNLYSASELWTAIYQDDDKLWYYDPDSRLINVSLNEDEVQILHIASRLYHQSIRSRFPASVSFLQKLADASSRTSANLAEMIRETADEISSSGNDTDNHYAKLIRTINTALHQERNLSVDYQRKDGSIRNYNLLPLMLEPYSRGKSLYLIARDNEKKRIISLRSEKIEKVQLLAATRLINRSGDNSAWQEMKDLRKRIREERQYSWGIWGDAHKHYQLKLVFDSSVSDRVQQTEWHPYQKVYHLPEGKLGWEVELSELKEIVPWIRSWGPAVEVINPPELRDIIKNDIEKLRDKYQ